MTGVRFYKGAGNTGTHVGSLWGPNGQRLAQVTFANETATGWQTATFGEAVPLLAGTNYTVSYTAPRGHYASESWAFVYRGLDTGAMQVAGGWGAQPPGVFGGTGTMPAQSYQWANYFVDVAFSATDDSPLIGMSHVPAPSSSAIPATTTVSARFSKPMAPGTPGLTLVDSNGATVAGTRSYDATTRTITFTPSAPLASFVRYTATLAGTDAQGNPIASGGTWSFTTAKPPNPPGVCPCSLFSDETTPTILEINDGTPLTLGTRFTSDVKGVVTGVRFYKSPGNTGAHVGSLWNQNGVELASGTFTNESASGWQQLNFATPVAIAKNTPYIVSYRSTTGRYSATLNAFSERDLSWAPLRVTSTAGAYTYAPGFPGGQSSTSYMVDVVFDKTPPSISMTSQSPAPGALDVPRASKVVVDLSDQVEPGWSLTVGSGGALAGTAVLSADRLRITWTPSAPMPAGADVTVTLAGVTTADGANLGTRSWTFRTRSAETLQNQTLLGDVVPDTTAADDGAPLELGMAFTPSRNGTVKAIRFFKGVGNNGTHTGSIWSAAGSRLATVTFANETATGWQTATLAQPLEVTAGTTYVVSYFAPQGHYSVTSGFFSNPLDQGRPDGTRDQQRPLRVLVDGWLPGLHVRRSQLLRRRALRAGGRVAGGRRTDTAVRCRAGVRVGQAVAHRVRAARHGVVDERGPERYVGRRHLGAVGRRSHGHLHAQRAADGRHRPHGHGLRAHVDRRGQPADADLVVHDGLRRLRHDVAVRRRHPGHGGG